MKKKRFSRDILILVILSLITAFTWIGLDVHRILFEEEEIYVPAEQLEALNPEIDQQVIDQVSEEYLLEKEEYLPPEEVSEEATEAGLNAKTIANIAGEILGGGGSGTQNFAQAGGPSKNKLQKALNAADEFVKKVLHSRNK